MAKCPTCGNYYYKKLTCQTPGCKGKLEKVERKFKPIVKERKLREAKMNRNKQ